MFNLQTGPYKLYKGAGGNAIHFNEETLALTEVTQEHIDLLELVGKGSLKDGELENKADPEILIEAEELGLVKKKAPAPYQLNVNLHPSVAALRIVLTEQCNLRCAECFVTKEQDTLRTMRPEVLDRVIRDSIRYGKDREISYHFFGGEPLIRFDLIKRAVVIVEAAIGSGEMIRPSYSITTNLTLLNEEILKFFGKHRFEVGVSIDGPEEVNDMLRPSLGGQGTYKKVAANYDKLVAAGISSHVLITPHADYIGVLPEMFTSILERFSMKSITVNTPLHFNTLQWLMPGEEYAKLLLKLIGIAQKFGIEVDSAASPPLAALSHGIRREGPCALMCDRIMASVGPDGSLSFCSQKWHPALTVRSVSEGRELKTPVRRKEECTSCEARHICGGPCPALRLIAGVEIDPELCAFMKTLLREVAGNLGMFEAVST